MIDTVHAYYDVPERDRVTLQPKLPKYVEERIKSGTKYSHLIGYKNLNLLYDYRFGELYRIRLTGSFPKYIYDTNIRRSDLLTSKRTILRLKKRTKLEFL